ncbi:LysR family transcriptional regulator substrate-binding protein [Cellulomonas sp. ICMP 17802]|uniref:LysR family transcriptional regulator substrate-binding protein n=1 Tax=Cellulomonas sp. ICMP 17802 TaxID=3239199 RepID=UPI00351B6D98
MTAPRTFRVALSPGVNPDRWLRVWQERLRDVPVELVHTEPAHAPDLLRSGAADVALLRLPAAGDDLSVIPLYTEATVVVVPKDHLVTVVEELDAADLVDETVVVPLDDTLHWAEPPGTPFAGDPVPTTADAVDLVAAGVAVLVLPQSLGRLHQRRGLTARVVRDAPGSAVGLAWVTDRYDDLTEEFIGIVRGRTATSSRGVGAPAPAPELPAKKPTGRAGGPSSSGKGGASSSGKGGASSSGKGRASSAKGKPKPRKPRPGR